MQQKDNAPAAGEDERNFASSYRFCEEKLGEGQYAVVRKAEHIRTKKFYAVKCIEKDGLSEEDLQALIVEVQAMRRVCTDLLAAMQC